MSRLFLYNQCQYRSLGDRLCNQEGFGQGKHCVPVAFLERFALISFFYIIEIVKSKTRAIWRRKAKGSAYISTDSQLPERALAFYANLGKKEKQSEDRRHDKHGDFQPFRCFLR